MLSARQQAVRHLVRRAVAQQRSKMSTAPAAEAAAAPGAQKNPAAWPVDAETAKLYSQPRYDLGGFVPTKDANMTQRLLNERLYELQNSPNLARKYYAGYGLEWLDIKVIEKQTMILFIPALAYGLFGAHLYRLVYMEKYNLWDMFNWEQRVLREEAKLARGW